MRNNNRERNGVVNSNDKYVINAQIKSAQVRLITEAGENVGLVSRQEALDRAAQVGLDLVKIGDQDEMVVAKIMDFGKFLYLKKKQQNEAKKHQKVIQVKEVKMRPNIGDQDYQTKLAQSVQFLKDGKRVKLILEFHGREIVTMNEAGRKFFERLDSDFNAAQLGTLIAEREQRGQGFGARASWSKLYYLKGA